jgi:hypothetical protein
MNELVTSAVCLPTPPHVAALERLGDEIAELSAHLDPATARLLDLIREFDARGGWIGARSRWRTGRRPPAIGTGPSRCTRTRTGWWWCGGG